MKVLLPSYEIIKRRPKWTYSALSKFMSFELRKNPASSLGKEMKVYDIQEVIEFEETETFKKWYEQYQTKKGN
jgi:hypothetical protein